MFGCDVHRAAGMTARVPRPTTPMHRPFVYSRVAVVLLLTAVLTRASDAQRPDSAQRTDTTRRAEPPKAAEPAKTPQLDFSGILFANWSYRTDRGARAQNRFDVERAYLTFRMPAGDRASIRITADIFQNAAAPGDAFYRGWAFRAKYAYLQYDALRSRRGLTAVTRLGMLHTVVIEHVESFWPRWISRTATELNGFFQSADLGLAAQFGLPNRRGEVYATVTNGPGYTSRETDRFKDAAVRLTFTPFASQSGFLQTTAVSMWGYRGAIASRFVAGGAGQVGAVAEGLQRDRWGVFAGLRERRLTLGAEFAKRIEEGELGNNTLASPRVVIDSTSTLVSAFAIVRPFELMTPETRSPLAAIVRYDRARFNDETGPAARLIIAGLVWDVTSRVSMAADYQQLLPRDGASGADSKTWLAHVVATF
jgi:hypothetical protein